MKKKIDEPKKRGRPISDNPKSPRAAYMRELMRKRRAREKALSIPKPILPTPTQQEGDKP